MAYVRADGTIGERSPWRLSIVVDLFWGIINFIVLFFRTLISPGTGQRGSSRQGSRGSSGNDRRWPGAPGNPRPRFGGFGPSSSGPSCPPMAGGG